MAAPLAISGDFADLKSVKTRSVIQIVIECPIEEGESIVRMFGFPQPGKPVRLAVARLLEGSVASEVERRRSPGQPMGAGGLAEVGGSIPSGVAKRTWADMSPAQQAGIRCNEEAFQRFLRERGLMTTCTTAEDAATYVRFVCGVHSRAKIGSDRNSLVKWRDLDAEFQAWLTDPSPASTPMMVESV